MITIYSTIHEYLNYWNDTTAVSENNHSFRQKYITECVAPCLGTVTLNQYNEQHVRMLRVYLGADERISEIQKFTVLRIFRQAMNYAAEKLLIADAFCDSLYIPKKWSDITVYTQEELTAIFDALKYERLYNYYRLIYHTGIRDAEARAIRMCNIDIQNRRLCITHRMEGNTRHNYRIIPVENEKRNRCIYLTDETISIIQDEIDWKNNRNHIIYSKENQHRYAMPCDGGFLFTTRDNVPIAETFVTQTKYLVEQVSGVAKFNTRSLRYTAVDAILNAGCTEKEVQDYFGYGRLSNVFRLKERLRHESGIKNHSGW